MDDPRIEHMERTGEQPGYDSDPVLVTGSIDICISTTRGEVGDDVKAFIREQISVLGVDSFEVGEDAEVESEK